MQAIATLSLTTGEGTRDAAWRGVAVEGPRRVKIVTMPCRLLCHYLPAVQNFFVSIWPLIEILRSRRLRGSRSTATDCASHLSSSSKHVIVIHNSSALAVCFFPHSVIFFISDVALLWKKDYLRKTTCDWLYGYDAAFVKLLWPLVCICWQKCTELDVVTFQCFEGSFGGFHHATPQHYCNSTSSIRDNSFSVTCIVAENNAFLGYFNYPVDFLKSVSGYNSEYSYRSVFTWLWMAMRAFHNSDLFTITCHLSSYI